MGDGKKEGNMRKHVPCYGELWDVLRNLIWVENPILSLNFEEIPIFHD